jgi:hypothetical protein
MGDGSFFIQTDGASFIVMYIFIWVSTDKPLSKLFSKTSQIVTNIPTPYIIIKVYNYFCLVPPVILKIRVGIKFRSHSVFQPN